MCFTCMHSICSLGLFPLPLPSVSFTTDFQELVHLYFQSGEPQFTDLAVFTRRTDRPMLLFSRPAMSSIAKIKRIISICLLAGRRFLNFHLWQ